MKNKNIKKLQQEYEIIQIPDTLEARIKSQIQKAKVDSIIEASKIEQSSYQQGEKIIFDENKEANDSTINDRDNKSDFTNRKSHIFIKRAVQIASAAIIFFAVMTYLPEELRDGSILEEQEVAQQEAVKEEEAKIGYAVEHNEEADVKIYDNTAELVGELKEELPIGSVPKSSKDKSVESIQSLTEGGNYEDACYGGVMLETIFLEESNYIEVLSEYMKAELLREIEKGMLEEAALSHIENFEMTGEEYIYFNEEEDLVVVIVLEGENPSEKEVVIPIEEIKDLLNLK